LLQYIYTDEKYRAELRRLGLLIHDAREKLSALIAISDSVDNQLVIENEIKELDDQYIKTQKKIRGQRTGVMIAVPACSGDKTKDDKHIVEVEIGFSFLNKKDKWDFIGEKHVPGFGVSLAESRGSTLYTKTFKEFLYTKKRCGYQFSSRIPMKYAESIFNFVDRCKRYYKDTDECIFVFPQWVTDPTGPFFKESIVDLVNEIYQVF